MGLEYKTSSSNITYIHRYGHKANPQNGNYIERHSVSRHLLNKFQQVVISPHHKNTETSNLGYCTERPLVSWGSKL